MSAEIKPGALKYLNQMEELRLKYWSESTEYAMKSGFDKPPVLDVPMVMTTRDYWELFCQRALELGFKVQSKKANRFIYCFRMTKQHEAYSDLKAKYKQSAKELALEVLRNVNRSKTMSFAGDVFFRSLLRSELLSRSFDCSFKRRPSGWLLTIA